MKIWSQQIWLLFLKWSLQWALLSFLLMKVYSNMSIKVTQIVSTTLLHNMIIILKKERKILHRMLERYMRCRQGHVLDASELAEVSTCLDLISSSSLAWAPPCELPSPNFCTLRDTAFPFDFFMLILSSLGGSAGRVSSQFESVNTTPGNVPIHTLR